MADQWQSTDDQAPAAPSGAYSVSGGIVADPDALKKFNAAPDARLPVAPGAAPAIQWQSTDDQAPKPRTWLDSAADYAKGAIESLAQTGQGMVDMGKAVGQTVLHPIDTAEGKTGVTKMVLDMGASQDALRVKAEQAFKAGDYVDGVRHVLDYLIPIIGPSLDQLGDMAGSGQLARSLGGATALGFQLAVPEALNRTVPPVAAPLAPGTVPAAPRSGLVDTTLNPVQQRAIDYLRQNNVPLNAGTVTGNDFLKGAQRLVQNQPLGAPIAKRAMLATEEGLTRVAGNLADQAHPEPVTPESAGAAVPRALGQKIEDLGAASDTAYAQAWAGRNDPQYTYNVPVRTQQVPVLDDAGRPTGAMQTKPVMGKVNMPVDVTNIKDQLKPVWDEMQWMPASDRASSAGYTAVKNILEGDDYIPAWQAEKGLGGLKSMARTSNKTGVRNASQGIAAGIIPELQGQIDAAVANTGDAALRGLQEGRATHASKMEIVDLAEQLREEPVQAFDQLRWKNDTGIAFLRKINEQAPQVMPQVGRAYLEKLFDQATGGGGFSRAAGLERQWETLGPETKKLLYPNRSLRADLDNFFQGAKLVAENPNPSGTAPVLQLGAAAGVMLSHPLVGASYLLGGGALAKLLYSPAGVRLLTGALKGGESAASAAARMGKIIDITGGDDVTPIPPGGGASPTGGGGATPPAAPAPTIEAGPHATTNTESNPGATGKGAPVPGSAPAVAAPNLGAQTRVRVPGSGQSYNARYEVKELADVQASHNGQTFTLNPRYALRNDRNYSAPENQRKILDWSGPQFDPAYHVTNNPDAVNGPPVLDAAGNVLGGNGRMMILQRVYNGNQAGAAAYRRMLTDQAPLYGIDPAAVAKMKQPVLVRVIPDTEGLDLAGKQSAVTNFNQVGTAALKPSEKAIADSRNVSQATLDHLSAQLEARGPAATLADVLEGPAGPEVLRKLEQDGVLGTQEAAALEHNGVLTQVGKDRIAKLMLGRFFEDPESIDRTPASIRNKLERMAAPLVTVEGDRGWSLTQPVQEALKLLEDASAHGMKNLDEYLHQGGLLTDQQYSPEAVTLAKHLQSTNPTDLGAMAREYAQDARFAAEGSGLFGEAPTPAGAFQRAFRDWQPPPKPKPPAAPGTAPRL